MYRTNKGIPHDQRQYGMVMLKAVLGGRASSIAIRSAVLRV